MDNAVYSGEISDTEGYNKPYRVLSLDGGGMRGLYTASVLQSLVHSFFPANDSTNKDVGKGFDLIVGTSTGGILACGLAAGVPINQIINLYSKKGKEIFKRPFPYEGSIRQFHWTIKNRRHSAHSDKVLRKELNSIFGQTTIGQLYSKRKISLCIPAVNLLSHSPKVFKTPHNPLKQPDNDRTIIDVCLATAAAPILLPIAHIANPKEKKLVEHFVDGGLWANNPVLVALNEAVACSKSSQPIEIISVGTCPPATGEVVLNKKPRGGVLDWRCGIDLMELMMDSQSKASLHTAQFLVDIFRNMQKNIIIHRLKQSVPTVEQAKYITLDQANKMTCQILKQLGQQDGKETYEEIEKGQYAELKAVFTSLSDLKEI